jgi:LEA14-like dessication related protein
MRVMFALALLTLAGCAGIGAKLEAPKLSIVNAELVKGDLLEQRLKVRMRVQNPNDRELAVKGITYSIDVGGEAFGNGMSASSFTVPRLGEAEFDMLVTANMAGTLLKMLGRLGDGRRGDGVEYRIYGKVSLASGLLRSIPFEEKGQLKF